MDAVSASPRLAFVQQRWYVLALVLFFVVFSVRYGEKVLDTKERDNRSAFLRWREQILEMQDGVNIWEKYNYPNPPIMVLLLEPLVPLQPLVGSMAWYYLKVVMALAAIYLVFRLVEIPGRPWPTWAKVFVLLLSLRPIEGDLSHGNVNLFILLLCVAGLVCFRRRYDYAAGGLLALAIACKVTPALFVPYFLWKRSWKVLAGCGGGLVLFFWIVPGLFFGFERNNEYLLSWYRGMIAPFAVQGMVTTEHQNQSLPGLMHRLLTESPSFGIYDGDRYVPLEYHNVVAWDPAVVSGFVKLCMLAFAGLVMLVCRNPTTDRQSWQLAAEYGLVLVGMLLFSERTWKHHCVTMLVPFGALVYYLAAVQAGPRMKKFVLAMLIAVALLMTATSTGGAHWLARAGKIAQVYGAYVWANVALTAALALVLWRHKGPVGQPAPEAGDTPTYVVQLRAQCLEERVHGLTRACRDSLKGGIVPGESMPR
jgi:alpha-1,2-mannosyltransferase